MSTAKKVAIALLGLIAIGAAGLGVYYVLTGKLPFEPEVLWIKHRWGAISEDFTEIRTTVAIRNPNPVPARLKSIGYTIYMNGLPMASGSSMQEVDIPANGVAEIELSTLLNNSMIPLWWVSHVGHGEHTEVYIKGSATVAVLGISFTIPIEASYDVKTDIAGSLSTDEPREVDIISSPVRIYVVIRSIHTFWGDVTAEWTQAVHRVVVENPNDMALVVSSMRYEVIATWPEPSRPVYLALGSQPLNALLGPGDTIELTLTTYLNNTALRDWWVGHVGHGEATTMVLRVYATFEVELPFGYYEQELLIYEGEYELTTNVLGQG